jgi:hypothetical protein
VIGTLAFWAIAQLLYVRDDLLFFKLNLTVEKDHIRVGPTKV